MTRILYSLCGADAHRPFSPHAWKVVMALKHKGLEYTEQPTPFTQIPNLENGFSKTVPILRDGNELIRDSFDIAVYLDERYPDRPTLFGGEGGKALSRFVEGFSQTVVHGAIARIAIKSVHDTLGPADQAYFRSSREAIFGRSLEEVAADRQREIDTFAEKLKPVTHTLKFQLFLGGEAPLFADYILFGALQWLRVTDGADVLGKDGLLASWFERLLDLHDSAGRVVTAA